MVSLVIQHIEQPKKIIEEGLYRKSGDLAKINKMKTEINQKGPKCIKFEDKEEIHTYTGLLKLYFREMPEPIIPYNLYGPCIVAAGSPAEIRSQMIAQVLGLLPPANKAILKLLCVHLQKESD
uniref:Rho-GAP domain-containing protein n=1 Tax=Arcella intermedia TaxID=1963864 RepID=A0A6B2LQ19_9EUKA